MLSKVSVTLDTVAYVHKPTGKEIGHITRRLQCAGPTTLKVGELAQAVADGVTWCGGCFRPAQREWGEFVSKTLYALDFDNDTVVRGEDGNPLKDEDGHTIKRPLTHGEPGFLDPWDALSRWRSIFGSDPLIMYPSMSYHCDTVAELTGGEAKLKYRVVGALGGPHTDAAEAKASAVKLLRAFPEADAGCVNNNRLFFGSCGRAVLFTEGGPRYVRRT